MRSLSPKRAWSRAIAEDSKGGCKSAPANFQQLQRVPTKTNAFFLYFDPSVIEPARFGKYFDYTFHVAVIGAIPPVWYSCGTQVDTQGAFLDRSETVHFTVHLGSTIDDGAMDVPLHSIGSRDFIEITTVTKPAKVDLSQSAGIELSLHNLLPDQDLLVDPAVQATASHPGYWFSTANVKLQDAVSKDDIRIHCAASEADELASPEDDQSVSWKAIQSASPLRTGPSSASRWT